MTQRTHDVLKGAESNRHRRNPGSRGERNERFQRVRREKTAAHDRHCGRCNRAALAGTRNNLGAPKCDCDTTNECVLKIFSLNHSSPYPLRRELIKGRSFSAEMTRKSSPLKSARTICQSQV